MKKQKMKNVMNKGKGVDMERQNYTVQLTETRRFESEIYAESEEKAIAICKQLHEEGFLIFDSEDVISADYKIKREG